VQTCALPILDDAQVVAVLDKMVKQRRDSVAQYEAAGREDLAQVERDEITVIERYLPAKMDEASSAAEIEAAVVETGAAGPADMGKLMGVRTPRLAGKADMGLGATLVKQRLAPGAARPHPPNRGSPIVAPRGDADGIVAPRSDADGNA